MLIFLPECAYNLSTMINGSINTWKLKALRTKKKLTQSDVDTLAKIGPRTTRNAELGKGITVKTLRALAEALGVHPGYFLD